MAAEGSELIVPEKEDYVKIPYEMLGMLVDGVKITLSQLLMMAKVFSFSARQDAPTARCYSRYKDFAGDFGISMRTTARNLSGLVGEGKPIERVKNEDGAEVQSVYRYAGDPLGKRYIRLDLYLLQTEFEIGPIKKKKGTTPTVKRCLKISEAVVLAYILANYNRNRNEFKGSVRTIASALGVSMATVSEVLRALLAAKLLFCLEEDKGKGPLQNRFHVNGKIIRTVQKKRESETAQVNGQQVTAQGNVLQVIEEPKKVVYVSKAVAAADAKTDRDRFYAARKAKAEGAALKNKERACTDPRFKELDKELGDMELALAKAEVYEPGKLPELCKKQKRLRKEWTQRLKELGFDEKTFSAKERGFIPQYYCDKCSDTGFLPSGKACKCYHPNS